MVTLYYMRRYVRFLADLLEDRTGRFTVTEEVDDWIGDTASALAGLRAELGDSPDPDALRYRALCSLGTAAARFRERVYSRHALSGTRERDVDSVRALLADAQSVIDHCMTASKRDDGLYHAYNIASFNGETLPVRHLYPMLEGQVAALSAGTIAPDEAADVVEALYASKIYRADQRSFMLYPDRDLPGFLARNRVPEDGVRAIPSLARMLERDDDRIIARDAEGCLRFNADFRNAKDLLEAIDRSGDGEESVPDADREAILELYESVFHHSEFTGRSGTMFGFEGLGSIYWHMVAKLLLALAENYFAALDDGAEQATLQRLGDLYYRVRAGIGFNKSPAEYGAFPTDPYSHTPKHAGARQPGMTGQVKEEVLTRYAELGVRVHDGRVSFRPALLRRCEFTDVARPFEYLDVDNSWQTLDLSESSLAFTWCQVPIVYRLGDGSGADLIVELDDGSFQSHPDLTLSAELSSDLFARNGRIRKITATLAPGTLFSDSS